MSESRRPDLYGYGAAEFVTFIHEWGHPEWAILSVDASLDEVVSSYCELFGAAQRLQNVPVRLSKRSERGMGEWIPFVRTRNCSWTAILRWMCVPIEAELEESIQDAQALSNRLKTRALAFMGEDTSFAMQCNLFKNGRAIQPGSWENQGNDADRFFERLGIYIPACYSQEKSSSVWVSAVGACLSRIERADVILPQNRS